MEFVYLVYLLACQVRVTVGDSGVCRCVCVTSFERSLPPLFVDSVNHGHTGSGLARRQARDKMTDQRELGTNPVSWLIAAGTDVGK